jgi:hypothetical protein
MNLWAKTVDDSKINDNCITWLLQRISESVNKLTVQFCRNFWTHKFCPQYELVVEGCWCGGCNYCPRKISVNLSKYEMNDSTTAKFTIMMVMSVHQVGWSSNPHPWNWNHQVQQELLIRCHRELMDFHRSIGTVLNFFWWGPFTCRTTASQFFKTLVSFNETR